MKSSFVSRIYVDRHSTSHIKRAARPKPAATL
jgi:hypothetical protein